MSSLSKIFDSLNVVLYSAELRENFIPVRFSGLEVEKNILIQLHKGIYYNENEKFPVAEGSFYFRPSGSIIDLKIGQSDNYLSYFEEDGIPSDEERKKFQRILPPHEDFSARKEVFSYVVFDVLLHNTFPLFKILQLPRIPLPYDDEMNYLVRELCRENYENKLGKDRLLKNYTEEIVIRICRHLASLHEYEKNLEKIDFLGDKRLTAIIDYIRSNIGGDLSNKQLARISFLSEDYIGQFFKNLTNQSLQDYVENQRLEMAMQKLNTTADSVSEIAFSVGFKDPAYFSRRFKMKYNVNANSIRNSKSTIVE